MKSALPNPESDYDFEFLGQKFDCENFKIGFLIHLESHFETPTFEFSDIENPKICFFSPKFKFFF